MSTAPRRFGPLAVLALAVLGACAGPDTAIPECQAGGRLAILAQAVPSASMVPCVREMPVGWSFSALDVESGRARFWLDSDRAGVRALEVELAAACDTGGASSVEPEEDRTRRFQRLASLTPRFAGATYDVFEGGCVTYRYELTEGAHIALHSELHEAVSLFPRQTLAAELQDDLGLRLDP
ncbi:MAG: hypothetical protein M3P97_04500 [Actinomycetota bacterium]|nr:hypothetical protein [Actinomycetota bacterium]